MKVVFYSSSGEMVGGAVMCLKEILLHCKAKGIECYVILCMHGNLEEFLNQHGIPYTVVRSYDWLRLKNKHGGIKNCLAWKVKAILNFVAEKKVKRILKQVKPDVYHINVIYNPCGAISAKQLGIPVVWHLREYVEVNDNTPYFHKKEQAFRLIGKSDEIILVSDCLKEFYSQYLPEQKLVRIHDGIRMPAESAFKRTVKEEQNYTITISGGARVKGHIDALRALQILKYSGYDKLHLRIAGVFVDTEYLESLKCTAEELEIADNLEFMGFQTNMNHVWNTTDIALVCSRFESFGLSAVEAMTSGIPLICAKSTGSYEITNRGELARIYEVGDYKGLAECLKEVVDSYERYAETAMQTALYIRDKFDITLSCEQLIREFERVCKEGT